MFANRILSAKVASAVTLILAGAILAYAIGSETPVGSLRGKVIAQESGNPIWARVKLQRQPEKDGRSESFQKESTDGTFRFVDIPAGEYTMSVECRYRHTPPIKIEVEEGKTVEIDVEVPPGDPFVDLYIHQHVFTPDERAQVTCRGYLKSSFLELDIYKVNLDAFLKTYYGSLQRLLGIRSYYWDNDEHSKVDLTRNTALTRVKFFKQAITSHESDGVFTQRIDLPTLRPGLYVVAVRGNDIRRLGWVMVTSLGLVTKTAGSELLAFVTDLKSGIPKTSAKVSVYSNSGKVISGKTTPNGLVSFNLPTNQDKGSERTVVATDGDSFAFVSAYMSLTREPGHTVYAYTDRPVYRPGQTVYFKGIVRKFVNEKYQAIAGKPVKVEVRDPRDTLVYRGALITNRFGSYHGKFDLNPETATGTYSLVTIIDGEGREEGTTFRVAAYSKPEFSVKVEFAKKRYIRNDRVKARISASYYFGAPVVNARVSYIIRRTPYWLFYEDEDFGDYEYEDYGGYGEVVDEGELMTDDNGIAEVAFRAAWPEPETNYGWDNDQEFFLEAWVTDASRRGASGSSSVIVTRGEFALNVTPDLYVVQPGSKVRISIEAKDYDKNPIQNKELTAVIGREYWIENRHRFDRWEEKRLTTDRSGRASFEFIPKRAGNIRVTVVSKDARGNNIMGSTYVWCYSEALEDTSAQFPDLQLVTDKKSYRPGETAKLLINANDPGPTALVTVEGPRIYDKFTVKLSSKSTAVDIPIKSAYRPKFYIGVCFVHNKNFVDQQARAKVSLGAQMLSVKIATDKERYLPGEKAIYRIKTQDSAGKPVSAELSLGVVDEAIYAVAEDRTEPILDYFYSHKPNEVDTQFSFPQIYLSDPDKATALAKMPRRALSDVYTRKRFLDTAFWKPDIVTDSNGEATVTFDLPDNLTTWRATARAITLDTRCGQAVDTVLAQQDLLIRLEMPRFAVQGDTTTISAIVHNYTGSKQNVKIDFEAPGLKVRGKTRPRIEVPDRDSRRVDWAVGAPKPGDFRITVRATCQTTGDAIQITLPVYPHGEERTATITGELIGNASKLLYVPVRRDSIPETTKLRIRLAPSLASAMLGSLEYLAQYPYGCTEQTMSAFLPDVILQRTMKELGIRNARLEEELPDMVSKGLFRLYRLQLEDGGWSWCEYGKADPWMTAYVCYGLLTARNAGFVVNNDVLSRGLGKLAELVKRPKLDVGTKAYGYYVLALAERGDKETESWPARQLTRISRIQDLDVHTLAITTLGLAHVGLIDQAQTMLKRLWSRAIAEPSFVHWEDNKNRVASDVETTALALQATLKVNPKDLRVNRVIRWLMTRRQGNCWYSTRDTAMTLYAMADYLKSTHELAPDYDTIIKINDKIVARLRFDKASILEPDIEIAVSARDLRKGRNKVLIGKSGKGSLYYSLSLTQYLTKDKLNAVVTGSGVSIARSYYKPGRVYSENGEASGLGAPVKGCSSGDVILVRLTLNATKRLEHLLLEDFLPAGCEVTDQGHVDYWDWNYWWIGRDVRDEKISFYIDSLSPGKHVVTYYMRAGIPGKYRAMPAQVWAMYDPRVRATTAEAEFDVR